MNKAEAGKEVRSSTVTIIEKAMLFLLVVLVITVVGLGLLVQKRSNTIDDINVTVEKVDVAAQETQRVVHEFETRALEAQACQTGSTTPTTIGQCAGSVDGGAVMEGLQAIARMEQTLNELKQQLEETK